VPQWCVSIHHVCLAHLYPRACLVRTHSPPVVQRVVRYACAGAHVFSTVVTTSMAGSSAFGDNGRDDDCGLTSFIVLAHSWCWPSVDKIVCSRWCGSVPPSSASTRAVFLDDGLRLKGGDVEGGDSVDYSCVKIHWVMLRLLTYRVNIGAQ